MSLFNDIMASSVSPTLMEIFREADEWEYAEAIGQPWKKVVVHAGNVETQIIESLEREKKVRTRMLVLTSDPHDERYPGLAEVHKGGVFRSPAGELYSVADEELDSRSGALIRVKVQFSRMTKLDRYGEL